jgi:hypothetical protein
MQVQMISKLAETEIVLLCQLSQKEYLDQTQLCKDCGLIKSTASKALKKLESNYYIKKVKRGKYNCIRLNRNKMAEIKSILAIWKRFNYELKDKTKVLVRIHDFEVYSDCKVIANYDKQFYKKYYPKNRLCIRRVVDGVGKVNITLNQLDSFNNNLQIFISSYYLVLPIDITQKDIDQQITRMNNRLFNCLCELLASEGIFVGRYYIINEGSAALIDDWLAQLSIRQGIKNKNIDESHYLIPEFEIHSPNLSEKIHKVIALRKLILESKISESELAEYISKMQNARREN